MTIFIPSLQTLVDQSHTKVEMTDGGWDLSTLSSSFHDSYHSLEEMDVFGDALASKFGPLGIQVEKFSVGESWEGREIRGWKARMVVEPESENGKEPVGEREFVIQSGQHAREVCHVRTTKRGIMADD
jgi:hypothetical protein